MKRIISITLCAFLMITMLAALPSANAAAEEPTWTLSDDGTLTLLQNVSTPVPWDASKVKKVIIGTEVTEIGNNLFFKDSALTEVTFNTPSNVKTISANAFRECRSLAAVSIPDSVTSIGNYAFYICSSLTTLTLGNNVANIDQYAFYGCKMASVIIPDSVKTIGNNAFRSCAKLESVTIGKNVTSIGEHSFRGCVSLKALTIPDSVQTIGSNAFDSCNKLETLTIGKNVTSIGGSAFNACSLLASVDIPDSVLTIGGNAFNSCNNLKTLTIGKNVTSIGSSAFKACSLLAAVDIPDSVKTIGISAFEGCSALSALTLGKNITAIKKLAFKGIAASSIDVPKSVTSIGASAFVSVNDSFDAVTIRNKECTLAASSIINAKVYGCTASTAQAYCDTATNGCTFCAIDHAVECSAAEAGTGTLTADPAAALADDTVTFTATPASGYGLEKIVVTPEGGSAVTLTAAPYEYTMPDVKVSAVATFVPAYTFECEPNDAAYGSISAEPDSALPGGTVTFTATPNTGYELEKITLSYDSVSDGLKELAALLPGSLEYTVTALTDAVNYKIYAKAIFKAKEYTVTVVTPENGTLSAESETVAFGSNAVLTAVPADGYKLSRIVVTPDVGEAVESTSSPFEYTMADTNITAAAYFEELPKYTVTVTAPENGTLTADKSVSHNGGKVTFTAVPSSGYKLTKITVTPDGGAASESTSSPYEYTMPDGPVTASAEFELREQQISSVMSSCGEISLSSASAKPGEPVTVSAVAAKNYVLERILVKCGGENVPLSDDGEFIMPFGDVSVEAVYAPLAFLTGANQKITSGGGKDIAFSTNGNYDNFTDITIDGQTVDKSNYTSKKGSTIISLKSDYINKLKTGKHTITVLYSDGSSIDAAFTITSAGSKGVDTGDNMSASLIVLLSCNALLAGLYLFLYNPLKRRED